MPRLALGRPCAPPSAHGSSSQRVNPVAWPEVLVLEYDDSEEG